MAIRLERLTAGADGAAGKDGQPRIDEDEPCAIHLHSLG